MFRIKICGVTSVDDARAVLDSPADALGLNFYPQSTRYVEPELAARIAAEVEGRLWRVGVFVNSDVDTIEALRTTLPLDYIQLHGDEPPETARRFPTGSVIRALRCRPGQDSLAGLRDMLVGPGSSHPADWSLAALLIDAYQAGQYGGTGATADWDRIQPLRQRVRPCPLILAGGLTPENVADAIVRAEPDGVDTASGVERTGGVKAGGVKDSQRIREFAERADRALQQLGR